MTAAYDPEDDDGLTAENRQFARWMVRTIRLGVVDELLVGNDTQCFSTQQYAEQYHKSVSARLNAKVANANRYIPLDNLDWARAHLVSLPLKEVKPDIWIRATPERRP